MYITIKRHFITNASIIYMALHFNDPIIADNSANIAGTRQTVNNMDSEVTGISLSGVCLSVRLSVR